MKTRCFDHIDLRVKDMEVARKFYGKFLPELGFAHESPGDDFHTFFAGGSDRPLEFFSFDEDKNHCPNGTRIAFLGGQARRSGSDCKARARSRREKARGARDLQ